MQNFLPKFHQKPPTSPDRRFFHQNIPFPKRKKERSKAKDPERKERNKSFLKIFTNDLFYATIRTAQRIRFFTVSFSCFFIFLFFLFSRKVLLTDMKKNQTTSFLRYTLCFLLSLTLLSLVSCQKQSDKTVSPYVSSDLSDSSNEPTAQNLTGNWFCAEELFILSFSEDQTLLLCQMSDPVHVTQQEEGRYELSGHSLTLFYADRTEQFSFTLDSNRMLILTDESSHSSLSLTPINTIPQ